MIEQIIGKIVNKKKEKYRRYYNNDDSDDDDEEDYNKNSNDEKGGRKRKKNKNENFEELFVYNSMYILYDYLINNYNEENVQLFIKCFIEKNIDSTMKKLIEEYININEYFDEKEKSKISKKDTLLIEISFKYLDFCLILFFRENKSEFFEYWMKNRNKLYIFYCNYKLLSTEKYYEKNDFKEIFSLIAYISDSINCFDKKENKNLEDNKIFEIKFNEFNKYTSNIKEKDFITTFDIEGLYKTVGNDLKLNYNKLAIFCLDKNNNKEEEKYILQDIIDINELKRKKIPYNLKLSEEIYLVPINSVPTYLYAFGYNYNHSLGVDGNLSKFYDTPTKCSGLSKYSWNISYGQNYCLSLDEESNKIYACGCGKGAGFNSLPRKEFTTENARINNGDYDKEDKIIDFATGNCNTSVILSQKGEIFAIGENENNFLKIPNLEKNRLKFAKKLNLNINIKVVSMSISVKNCYIIDSSGNLYGIGDNSRSQISEDPDEEINEWTKISLPSGCKRFLQSACGERYLICLVEDDKGKGKIYSKGININNECGIKSSENNYITNLTQCDETYNLNFKSIYTRNNRSAAITKSGELYIWGKRCGLNNNTGNDKKDSDNEEEKLENIKCPTLVEFDKNLKNVIIDQAAISNTHIIAIGRSLEN